MAVSRMQIVAIRVDSSVLFRGRGDVKQWTNRVSREYSTLSKRMAPRRSGALRAGIRGTAATTGRRRCEARLWSYAPHTPYVVYGTFTPIMTTKAWATRGAARAWVRAPSKFGGTFRKRLPGMWLHLRPGMGYPKLVRQTVRGQKPQNFLYLAYRVLRRFHRALPPAVPIRR